MRRALALIAFVLCSAAAQAGDLLGYQRLRDQVGDALADGRGVAVAQVEPPSKIIDEDDDSKRRTHVPKSLPAFEGVKFHNVEPDALRGSRHATATAKRFYGRGHSMTPGVRDVHLYTANAFLRGLAAADDWPRARVWSHSWVGASGATDGRLLRSLDAAIVRHDWVVAVGVINRGANKPLLSSAFNVLSVGRSDGGHSTGAAATDALYDDRRDRPHLVAPAPTTSMATPQVASAAVLLLETLPEAIAHECVVRAALMAGASRRFEHRADPKAPEQPGYRATADVRSANGLDTRFGAGQLNIFNSYQIVTGKRVQSVDKHSEAPAITASGLDYVTDFGGETATRRARYRIRPTQDQTFTAALIWLAPGGSSRRIADLDLQLREISDTPRMVDQSTGGQDTGEHIRAALLKGRDYELEVSVARNGPIRLTDYALAWRLD